MRKASSFFNQLTLFKSQKSDDSDGDSKSLHKQNLSSSKCNNDKKSVMEKEWSKTCGQMDKRAQLLQVLLPILYI